MCFVLQMYKEIKNEERRKKNYYTHTKKNLNS